VRHDENVHQFPSKDDSSTRKEERGSSKQGTRYRQKPMKGGGHQWTKDKNRCRLKADCNETSLKGGLGEGGAAK